MVRVSFITRAYQILETLSRFERTASIILRRPQPSLVAMGGAGSRPTKKPSHAGRPHSLNGQSAIQLKRSLPTPHRPPASRRASMRVLRLVCATIITTWLHRLLVGHIVAYG